MRLAVVVWICSFAASPAQEAPEPKTPKEKHSYAIGNEIGNQLRRMSVDLDPDLVCSAIKDVLTNGKPLLNEAEIRANLAEVQVEAKRNKLLPTNTGMEDGRKAGEAFLAEKKKEEGVVTLPSRLQYRILKAGEGRKPTDTETVVIHYRGTLVNGTEFDSSYRIGQPATFAVQSVIPGWREALKLMAVGSRYQLFIPPELAYGSKGLSPNIGPNATLVFEVELLDIK
jgi:FKBP-type peptidyl-prolyl cis-trans isomerase